VTLAATATPTFGQTVESAGDAAATAASLLRMSTTGAILTLTRRSRDCRSEITVEDPAMFTAPWSALVTYRRALGEWPEAACPENRQEAGWVRHVPQADKPDF
jgi:hypothetical protein